MKQYSLKQQTLDHYSRMIEWARSQNPQGSAFEVEMLRSIGVDWSAEFCPVCRKYTMAYLLDIGKCGFGFCPLNVLSPFPYGCCEGLWRWMDSAQTWGEWADRAERVRLYISAHLTHRVPALRD